MKAKQIALSDDKYFELFLGKRVLKHQIFGSKDVIPIYSSNVFKPFGFSRESNITDFKHDYVIWGIDGNFEFNVKHKEEKFATTDHCGNIKILNSLIVPEFLVYQLEASKHEFGFDRTLRASLANMRLITISIPIGQDGNFDKDKQTEIMHKVTFIKKACKEMDLEVSEIQNAILDVKDINCTYKRVLLPEIFLFPETNSGITKELCHQNKGEIPVYGCSGSEDLVLGYIRENLDGVKYFRDCLTWNRNGSFVGYVFYREGLFTSNEDHRVLKIKPEFENQLSPLYLKYVLQNQIRKLGYEYRNKLGKTRMAEIQVEIPIAKNGEFDIKKQREIANRYKILYQMRQELVNSLNELSAITVKI